MKRSPAASRPAGGLFRVLLAIPLNGEHTRTLARGIARFAQVHRSWAVVIDEDRRIHEELAYAGERLWDGVITNLTTPGLIAGCSRLGIPLVDLLDGPAHPGIPKIRPDNRAVGHLAAEHFLERGFHHFAFCGLDREWSETRADGFDEALRLAGAPRAARFISDHAAFVERSWRGESDTSLTRWLLSLPRPLALFACNDQRGMVVGALCQKHGIFVPEDVAILGTDNDFTRCAFARPALSSIITNRDMIGYRAAETLDRLMRGNDAPPRSRAAGRARRRRRASLDRCHRDP